MEQNEFDTSVNTAEKSSCCKATDCASCVGCDGRSLDDVVTTAEKEPDVPENTLAGVVGALLFGLGGGAIAFFISQFGYVSALSGLITIVLSVFGYNLFSGAGKTGKVVRKKTIIICVIITAVVLLIAEYFSWAYSVYAALDIEATFSQCLRILPALLKETGSVPDFLLSLLLSYVFAAIGCFSFIRRKAVK